MFMTGLHSFQVYYIVNVVGGWIYHHAMSTSAPLPWPTPDSHPCSRFGTVSIFHHVHHQHPPPHHRSPHAAISATACILCSTSSSTPSTNPSPTPPPSSLPRKGMMLSIQLALHNCPQAQQTHLSLMHNRYPSTEERMMVASGAYPAVLTANNLYA